MITVGSLFSGIGGLDLAFEWAGASIAYQVEIDEYCRRVLAKHWPDVARHEDVKHVGRHNLPTTDIICGGVPCQPASIAGKQRGEADERWLWPDAIRIVSEMLPRSFLWENVPGLRTLPLGEWSGPLPKSGIAWSGIIWPLPTLAEVIGVSVFGLWVTPSATDTVARTSSNPVETATGTVRHLSPSGQQSFMRLSQVVLWATPTKTNAVQGRNSHANWGGKLLPAQAAMDTEPGHLNPDWVEQLMGFPLGWTLP